MGSLRAPILLAASSAMALASAPATAQVSDEIVLNIMRECARIDDPTARLACYDNNIRSAGANPRPSVPGSMPAPVGGSGAVATAPGSSSSSVQGFGHEAVRTAERFETPAGEVDGIVARIASVQQIGAGRYRFSLQDGAVWEFTDGVASSYRVPDKGSEIELNRASLGSFLMRFDNQQTVRVRRVR